jgi:hypothetical protein
MLPTTPIKQTTAAGGAASGQRARSPAAQYRWQLLKLAVKLRTARRQQLVQAWWSTVEAATRR